MAAAGLLWTFDDYEHGLIICCLRWIFSCTGNSLLFASLSLKTWWYILKDKGREPKNNKLYCYLGLVFIPIGALLIWKITEVYEKRLLYTKSDDTIEYQYECPDTTAGRYLYASQLIIAFVALMLCVRARDIHN